ncbi:MAG TPA: hypothetical protein VH575_28360 [Gemmataceae bacterium]|jgi:hypothetical protein
MSEHETVGLQTDHNNAILGFPVALETIREGYKARIMQELEHESQEPQSPLADVSQSPEPDSESATQR